MGASRSQIVLALWAAMMLAGAVAETLPVQSSPECTGTAIHQSQDCGCAIIGPNPPSLGVDVAKGCPHDGQAYSVCLAGNAKGGCKLQSQGPFSTTDCTFYCWFQSGVSFSEPVVLTGLPICANVVVGNQPGTLVTSHCPRDGQTYQVCLLGNSEGGCKPLPSGPWPTADCTFACLFDTSASSG